MKGVKVYNTEREEQVFARRMKTISLAEARDIADRLFEHFDVAPVAIILKPRKRECGADDARTYAYYSTPARRTRWGGSGCSDLSPIGSSPTRSPTTSPGASGVGANGDANRPTTRCGPRCTSKPSGWSSARGMRKGLLALSGDGTVLASSRPGGERMAEQPYTETGLEGTLCGAVGTTGPGRLGEVSPRVIVDRREAARSQVAGHGGQGAFGLWLPKSRSPCGGGILLLDPHPPTGKPGGG
jgi:hypothetical protein